MDRKLLDILVCPSTRQSLRLLDDAALAAVNRAISAGSVKRADGSAQPDPLQAALVTHDGRTVYRIDDGIPVLLADEAIPTSGIDGLPTP